MSELFVYQRITESSFAVKYNKTNRTLRHFNEFACTLGTSDSVYYDSTNDYWVVDQQGLESLIEKDKELFPDLIPLKEKLKDVIQVERKDVQGWEDIGQGMKLQPYDYQKEVIKFSLDAESTLIVSPCGSGKTPMGIGLFIEAHRAGKITGPGMIVVKASLKTQWAAEIKKFSGLIPKIIRTFKDCTSREEEMIKRRQEKLKKADGVKAKEIMAEIEELKKIIQRKFKSQFDNADLFVLNYETLRDPKVKMQIHKIHPQYVFADEIHYCKSDKTVRSKALCEFADAKIKAGATATPLQRDPRDIYGIFKFINPSVFSKKGEFEAMFVKWAGHGIVAGAKNEELLNKKISPYMIIKTKEEVSKQLPSLIVMQRYCEFEPAQQAVHQTLMDELAELKEKSKAIDSRLSAKEAEMNEELKQLDAGILMRQTFAQELTDSEQLLLASDSESAKRYITGSKDNKLELMLELIEEIVESGEKVCVFSRFAKMQEVITSVIKKAAKTNKLFDFKIAYVNGALSGEQRYTEVYTKFRDDDDYKLLLMSDAGAEGINLSNCQYMIELEPAESYAIETQRHGRLERADSIHDTVFVYQLICTDSYDEIAQKIVEKKARYDSTIIRGLVSGE